MSFAWLVVLMSADNSSRTQQQAPPLDTGSPWTDTFVAHSRNRLIHGIRYSFYERTFFRHITDRDAAILDVGCGSGEFIGLLRRRGFSNVHGVEIDDSLIHIAAGVLPEIRKSSATALPFEADSFDCVYMFNVMHHLSGVAEYEQALAEMTRCVRPGGHVIVIEPCRLILYRLLKAVCFAGRPFASFFRNFHLILEEEWPRLTVFLRHLDTLRLKIRTAADYRILKDCKLLHQWITVIAVNKNTPGSTS